MSHKNGRSSVIEPSPLSPRVCVNTKLGPGTGAGMESWHSDMGCGHLTSASPNACPGELFLINVHPFSAEYKFCFPCPFNHIPSLNLMDLRNQLYWIFLPYNLVFPRRVVRSEIFIRIWINQFCLYTYLSFGGF